MNEQLTVEPAELKAWFWSEIGRHGVWFPLTFAFNQLRDLKRTLVSRRRPFPLFTWTVEGRRALLVIEGNIPIEVAVVEEKAGTWWLRFTGMNGHKGARADSMIDAQRKVSSLLARSGVDRDLLPDL